VSEKWFVGVSPLRSLNREGTDEKERGSSVKVKVDKLNLGKYTARLPSRDYAKEHLDEMTRSLKELGQLNPILVKRQLEEIELQMFKGFDYQASGVCPSCGKKVKLHRPRITVNAWKEDLLKAMGKDLERLEPL